MSLTSDDVVDIFKKYCRQEKKMFLPGPQQNAIIESLIDFYESNYDFELLESAIEYYVKSSVEVVQVYDFAIVSGKMRDRALESRKDKEEIQKLMKHTESVMEGRS